MSATAESHSARYFALLYASAAQRPALEALFGIEREVFDSLRAGLDHHVAHSRLQWWREECERAASGRALHPLTRALVSALSENSPVDGATATEASLTAAAAVRPLGNAAMGDLLDEGATRRSADRARSGGPLDQDNAGNSPARTATVPPLDQTTVGHSLEDDTEEASTLAAAAVTRLATQAPSVSLPRLAGLCGVVDVAVWDLASATFETRRELDAYCQRWAAGMIEPLVGSSAMSPAALGAAMREIELLADFAREAHHGRIRLPLDELERASVDTNALANPPWPTAVAELMRARLSALRNDVERNLVHLEREQQPALRGLLVWAALAWRTSIRTERALPNRLQPERFDAISDAWFAWRMARRATIGQFRLG